MVTYGHSYGIGGCCSVCGKPHNGCPAANQAESVLNSILAMQQTPGFYTWGFGW
jgi:hypothetical protein